MNLNKYNWFRINAICEFFFRVYNLEDIKQAINVANSNNLKIFILGDGSNILLNENLTNYVCIQPKMKNIYYIEYKKYFIINVDAGYSIDKLVKYCMKLNIKDFVNFSGIPGTIGGAVFMNIHYKKMFFSDFLLNINVLNMETGEMITFSMEELNFQYKSNQLKRDRKYIIYNISLKIEKNNDPNYDQNLIRNIILKDRLERYPKSNTCGCFFYNLDKLQGINKSIGYQIDKLGIEKEYNFGNVKLHKSHKNMLVTNDKCTSHEILNLVKFISKKIYDELGYIIEPECEFVGFESTLDLKSELDSKSKAEFESTLDLKSKADFK